MPSAEAPHPALQPGRAAVITGAASGIGLATARQLAALHMKVVLADRSPEALEKAVGEVAAIALAGDGEAGDAVAVACDVSRADELERLADTAFSRFGEISFLMNNAGVGDNPGKPWENLDRWRRLIDINFWGAVHGVAAFVPRMLAQGAEGLIVNTGSKQGITTPPGNLAYNVSKSALKVYTEGLAHELRNMPGARLSAHLLIPGFTFTGLTTGATEKPAGAWTADQVAGFMLESLERGDFYILCPDNETTRGLDERRMAWAAGDIIENRPALSRWHPDFKDAFAAYLQKEQS
ncbi:MAG: SDR family NAD(P)-dependent oxidoreductase [Mesorhizobium sp.]|jgi:NAD(P)-dependent dehydrogenase (short-subunit alcohol dehydrogenase family)